MENCSQCGYSIVQETVAAKFIVCPACSTSLFFDNGQLQNLGKIAVIDKEPALFCLRKRFRYLDFTFVPVGRVRYGYGNGDGFWDEWWVVNDNGSFNWLSVDEGDVAIEAVIKDTGALPAYDNVQVGQTLRIANQNLRVTEKNSGTFIGAEGELPFRPDLQPRFNYLDLLGPKGVSFTIEYGGKGIECYKGKWVDPFEIVEAPDQT